jgi:hypothetical protein
VYLIAAGNIMTFGFLMAISVVDGGEKSAVWCFI